MPKATFIRPNGERVFVDKAAGTLMEIALDHDVEGITGDCGGVCSFSTCHVYIPPMRGIIQRSAIEHHLKAGAIGINR
jgi:2Fe-2S ferredoxin